MTAIKQEDLIQSVADAFQYISYYHPLDYIKALGEAYEREESPAAKDAIAQILTNSRMCAEGHRPICQDTGIAWSSSRSACRSPGDATMSGPGDDRRRRAPRLRQPGQQAARLGAGSTRPAPARTPRTTPRRWSITKSSPATTSK
jgi:hypothetical protein